MSSRTWRQRDKKLLELIMASEADENGQLPPCGCDLDPNATTYILVDTIDPKKDEI